MPQDDVAPELMTLPIEVAKALDEALPRGPRGDTIATGKVPLLRAATAAWEAHHRETMRTQASLMGVRPSLAAAHRSGPRALALMFCAYWLVGSAEASK